MVRNISIQPYGDPVGQMPYPFHIDRFGMVGRQEFWKGNPYKLIGFSHKPKAGSIDLEFLEFWSEPNRAVKMFPVFASRRGTWGTFTNHIMSVRVNYLD